MSTSTAQQYTEASNAAAAKAQQLNGSLSDAIAAYDSKVESAEASLSYLNDLRAKLQVSESGGEINLGLRSQIILAENSYSELATKAARANNEVTSIRNQINTANADAIRLSEQALEAQNAGRNSENSPAPANDQPGSNTQYNTNPEQQPTTTPAGPAGVTEPDQLSREQAAFLEANTSALYDTPPVADPYANETAKLNRQAGITTPVVPQEPRVEFGPDTTAQIGTADDGSQQVTIVGQRQRARESDTLTPFQTAPDWRFRISLAPSATYLYKADAPGILEPLKRTNGIVYPYMPKINVTYSANYDPVDVTHSNYKMFNYRNSSIDAITISGTFTAQDTTEADYLLAVIHFYKSATKMFYGQDQNPPRGVPPPLLYLSGLGAYQFDNHPVVLQTFQYDLPDDVDYINAGAQVGGVNLASYNKPNAAQQAQLSSKRMRLIGSRLQPGGRPAPPAFTNASNIDAITRVPTKISITVTCVPVITRNTISNKFSLKDYASGKLIRGSKNNTGGGIW
jgi:hypothetical protein